MRLIALSALIVFATVPAFAQQEDDPVPSQCLAIAETLPRATFASFSPPATQAQTFVDGDVTITYAGHSTYVIDTPGGVRIATDYSGFNMVDPLPRVVTMNKAHRGHFTEAPDPAIEYPLRGWNPDGGPASHRLVVDDVYIRNVPTDIRRWGAMEPGGNSIFIFEVAGLCIGHLGHLHHHLEEAHYGAIGRLDILMVPIDGGMTLSHGAMSVIVERLFSSIVLPMHRNATPMSEFLSSMGEAFDVEFSDERSFSVSLRSLPRRPTILVLRGV